LRSYEYPRNKNSSDCASNSDALVKSMSSISVAEAMAATTSYPLVGHAIKTEIGGRKVSLADGSLYSNCPVPAAIDEARQLYPGRPIGVVFSLGYSDRDNSFIDRIIGSAKLANPDMHFHRLVPKGITDVFDFGETCLDAVVQMEQQVHDYIFKNSEVSCALDITIKKLSNSRPSSQPPLGSPAYLRRQEMLQHENFLGRAKLRQELRENLKMNSFIQHNFGMIDLY